MPALSIPLPARSAPRTDALDETWRFRVCAAVARGLDRIGVPAVRRLPARDRDGYALAFAYTASARLWTLRHGPSWSRVHAAWSADAPEPGAADGLSGTLDPGDRVSLIGDGGEGFAAREALYAGARETVDVASYYVQSDETGWATARALAACAARGVRVRLLVDRFATVKKRLEVEGMQALLDFLSRSAIALRLWRDPRRPYDSNHRKLIAVDGRAAIVGGRNFADHYRHNEWRDVDLLLEGPSVAPLVELFDEVWAATDDEGAVRPDAPVPRARLPWADFVPERILEDPMYRYALASIHTAVTTVDLELAYLAAQDVLCGALEAARRRGVRVRVMTNSAESNDLPFTTYTAYLAMRRLLEAGVEVRARRGRGRTLHSKYFVADGLRAGFGSHNLDYYSSRFGCELNLSVRDERLGGPLTAFFETGWSDATPVDLEREVRPFLRTQRTFRMYDLVFRDFA